MKKIIYLISLIALMILGACKDKGSKNAINDKDDIGKLCSGGKGNVIDDTKPIANVSDIEGVVQYSDTVKRYFVSIRVEGTYDCVIVGYLEGDYSQAVGRKVRFDAEVYYSSYVQRDGVAGVEKYIFKSFKCQTIN